MGRRDRLAAKVIFAVMDALARAGGTADITTLRKNVEKNSQEDIAPWMRTYQ